MWMGRGTGTRCWMSEVGGAGRPLRGRRTIVAVSGGRARFARLTPGYSRSPLRGAMQESPADDPPLRDNNGSPTPMVRSEVLLRLSRRRVPGCDRAVPWDAGAGGGAGAGAV